MGDCMSGDEDFYDSDHSESDLDSHDIIENDEALQWAPPKDSSTKVSLFFFL